MSLLSPQLQAFMAVVRAQSVHLAAKSLNLTQTAVTQRIRVLERMLSTTLFIRTRRGMLLTQEGEALLQYCQGASALEGEVLAKIQGDSRKTEIEVSITAANSIMQARVIPQCLALSQAFPNLLLRFDINDSDAKWQKLKSGDADLAIIQKQHLANEMQYKALAPEEYVLVCSAQWRHRTLEDIIKTERIVDFEENDPVSIQYLQQHGIFQDARNSRHYVNSTENLAQVVLQGLGYTTLAKEFAQQYVRDGSLIILNQGKTYNIKPYLAWYERPQAPAYFQAILEAIQ